MDNISHRTSVTKPQTLSETLLRHMLNLDVHYWPGNDGMTLDLIMKSYAQAAGAGQVPAKNELLREHPQWATELEQFFATTRLAPDGMVHATRSASADESGRRAID